MFLVAIYRKMCYALMIDMPMIVDKAVFNIGSITLPDKKINQMISNFVCQTFHKPFGLFLLRHPNWIDRYNTMKIGRFFFV